MIFRGSFTEYPKQAGDPHSTLIEELPLSDDLGYDHAVTLAQAHMQAFVADYPKKHDGSPCTYDRLDRNFNSRRDPKEAEAVGWVTIWSDPRAA